MNNFERLRFLGVGVAAALVLSTLAAEEPAGPAAEGPAALRRVDRGLLALYDFAEGGGTVVHDRSGVAAPLDLSLDKEDGVRWSPGRLAIHGSVLIASRQPARKIIDAAKRSNAISLEAWLQPANLSQNGPARIVSLSADTSQRNVTLGQERDLFDVRLRAAGSDRNGLPSTSSPRRSAAPRLTHVVFTRDAGGSATLYIDGAQAARKRVPGGLNNWDGQYRLSLGNELTGDRPWQGELHLVAIFDQALTAAEVGQNFAAGVSAKTEAAPPVAATAFESQIAPLLAKHCLECHDSAIKKGGLDLSRKAAALAGGESGQAITPGAAADSLLWESVAAGAMPKDRPALSPEEKAALRKWLDDGAAWTADAIDPALYLHGSHAGEVWIQRLTVPEYIETVRAAVGVDIAQEARRRLPPDQRADGFSNTAYNLSVDLKHIEAYGQLAELIVARMDVLKFAGRFSKSRKLSTDDTMREHVAAMGKWLLRGPLDEREVDTFSGIATTVASAGGDFQQAMQYVIEAMLQSPRFLYRIEDQRGDGRPRPAGQYELASRMSYILWGAPPDEALLSAAERGELADRGRVEAQVQRMLKDPRTIARSSEFVAQWLNLNRLDDLRPNAQQFPNWTPELAADMRGETLAFFREVAWNQKRPLSDLLNAQVTFATPRLAEHYGLAPAGPELSQYDLSANAARGGLLTQGSVLTLGGDGASMVTRGLFVLHDLLRGAVNAPPPCVNTTPPPTKAGLTQRGIAEQRIANLNCGVCHARFEPLAFGLEKFDGIGAYHDRDQHGNSLREDGEILFPGAAQAVKYKTSAELMDLLAGSERVRESLTWKVTQFSVGRPLSAADAPVIAKIHAAAQAGGGSYSSLIAAIVMSDLVQLTWTQRDPPKR